LPPPPTDGACIGTWDAWDWPAPRAAAQRQRSGAQGMRGALDVA